MLQFDRADLNLGFAAAGSVAVAVVFAAVLAYGGAAGSGVFGFVLTGLAIASAPPLSSRRAVIFGLLGGSLTLFAFAAAGDPAWSAIVLGSVAAAAALASTRSAGAASWSYLAIWTVLALLLVEEGAEFEAAVSFTVGSLLATGVSALQRQRTSSSAPEADRTIHPAGTWFAITKGIVVAVGVLIGFAWLPEVPYWIALTVLIVAQPDDRATVQTALARSLGTLLGVAAGVLILSLTGSSVLWAVIASIGLIFCQMLFLKVNYVLYATFLTALIVVAASISNDDAGEVGWSRILATVLGAVLALAVTTLTPHVQSVRAAR